MPLYGDPPERFAKWKGYLELLDDGLISGELQDEGIDKVQVTEAGLLALAEPGA